MKDEKQTWYSHETRKKSGSALLMVALMLMSTQMYNFMEFDEVGFPKLLEAVAAVEGVHRIRYTSPHPQDVTEELLDVMASHESICNSIHFPLQSGSDRILKRMNRTYTKEHFNHQVDMMREKIPHIGISTDIIVGFPGETETDFQEIGRAHV